MIKVRRAIAGDERQWLSAVSSVLTEAQRGADLATAEEISSALADARYYLFLALSADAPVGLLSAYAVPDVVLGGSLAYLYDIAVAQAYRRTGIGGRLIEALLAACKADGVKLVWAGTAIGNAPARRTFKHSGGELVGEKYAEYEWRIS